MKRYCIKENYISRQKNDFFDDTPNTDRWQKEVYQYSKQKLLDNGYKSVVDIGTGSGYKLINNFNDYDTIGIDLPPTVDWLNKKYPSKKWSDKFEPVNGYDLLICSDVIEHIPDPDTLLELIKKCNPKLVVLSTPDRRVVYKGEHNGPPRNRSHCREWNKEEFYNYISQHMKVLEHISVGECQIIFSEII